MKIMNNKLIKVENEDVVNETVIIPSNVTTIGERAFSDCPWFNVVIPNSVTTIEKEAFYDSNLDSIVIPNSVTAIEDSTFENSHLESIVIPDSVTKVGNFAFAGCRHLNSIVIPDSVTYIGHDAFKFCKLERVKLSKNITKIAERTFFYCMYLKGINIPNSVTIIEREAFSGCDFKKIKIPNNVVSIGDSAFDKCRYLGSVVIPTTTKVAKNAFYGCPNYIYIKRVSPPQNKDHDKQQKEQTQSIVSMDNFNSILNELQSHIGNLQTLEIEPLNTANATSIKSFCNELRDYPMIISSAFYSTQKLDTNLKSRNKKLNKLLDAISGNDRQSLFEKIGNMFLNIKDGEIVLNKDAMSNLKFFSESELEMLKRQNQILEGLKEMAKLHNQKLKGCLNELDTTFVSDIDDDMEKSDMNSLNNAVQVKMASLNKQLLTMSITHDQINNTINSNILYMTSLNEVTTILLPSIISEVANNKLVIRKQESIEAIKQVADILKQAQNKPMEIDTPLEESKTSMR